MDPFFRFELRRMSRGGGDETEGFRAYLHGSVISAAAYRRGEKAETEIDGRRSRADYRKKRGIAYLETFAPRGAAEFALVSDWLWKEVERVEKRKDSLLAHELLITLPRDIPLKKVLKHLRRWIRAQCVAKGMVADLAVHSYGTALDPEVEEQAKKIRQIRASGIPIYPLAEGDLLRCMPPDHHHAYTLPDGKLLVYQPHAHILLTTRAITSEGFGLKVKAWQQKSQLFTWRESWAETYNKILAEEGGKGRVTAKGKRRRGADAKRLESHLDELDTISRMPLRTFNIRGGHWAALEGRGAKFPDEANDMTKYSFNDQVRAFNKEKAAFQIEREAADRRDEELVEAIARFQELSDQGVLLDLDEDLGLLIEGADNCLSEADARLLGRHGKMLAKVLASVPARPPLVDEALGRAMAVVDTYQKKGVSFFSAEKGALGFAPKGSVSPEDYRMFAGMHDAILGELKRRKYAALLEKGQEKFQEQKRQLEAAAAEKMRLQGALTQEKEKHRRLEQDAQVLFESARSGKPLPEVGHGSPLLQGARRLILGFRTKVRAETERAEEAEERARVLEQTVVAFQEGVAQLVRGLRWIVGKVSRWRPELTEELAEDYKTILAKLPEQVRAGIDERRAPGMKRVSQAKQAGTPATTLPGKSSHTPQSPAAGKEAWTLPKDLSGKREPSAETSAPSHSDDAAKEQTQRGRNPGQR